MVTRQLALGVVAKVPAMSSFATDQSGDELEAGRKPGVSRGSTSGPL
ncbi:hypothetical protein IMZ48_44220 [Candidatus Bathyarchaeota archaeon]|nr:hypothetical protein [Candidatus Bathyarchaeota archaeon]